MQELVYILNGRKKKNTGKVYYFHKGEHLVKFKYIKKKKFGHEKFRTKFGSKIITSKVLCCPKILNVRKF